MKFTHWRFVLLPLVFVFLNHLVDGGPFDLLVSVYAQSATTQVTATITDPNGLPYTNAAISVQLVPAPSGPAICAGAGQVQNPNPFTANANGFFSVNLCPNASISTPGTQWQFIVSLSPGVPPPLGTGPQTCSATVTISGVSQDISSSFSCPRLSNAAGGGTPCTSISSSLQYDNSGAFGCAPWIFTPADSSGAFCTSACASLTEQTSSYAGIGLYDPAVTSVYRNGVFAAKGTSSTGGSFIESDSVVISQGTGSGQFAQSGFFFSTISGNTGSSGSIGCVVETSGGPPCAAGLVAVGGDIETDTTSGQDLAGLLGGINMTKSAGKNIRFGAAIIANSPECSGDAPACASLFQPAESANSIFGLLVHDQGGLTTTEQAAIRIEPQTTPSTGSKFAIDAAAGSGVSNLADGIQTSGLKTALSTKSAAYTLTTSDAWINVTGNTTITVPHAQAGQRWDVFNSGSGTVTLQCDSGTINGAASITLAANTGRSVIADGTNCFAH